MPQPIANYSPEAVIEAIETNLMESTVALGRGRDAVVFRGADATWVYSGYNSLNYVMRTRFPTDEAEDRVAGIVACFQRWNAPVSWFLGPTSFPPEVVDYLKDSGFGPSEIWMGTAGSLQAIPDSINAGNPRSGDLRSAGLRIDVLTEPEDFKAWTKVSSEHWAGEDDALKIFTPLTVGADRSSRFYLGSIAGKPVVRGMAYVRGDVAGMYWISCKNEFRDRGFEHALALKAMLDARESGARIGVMPVRGATNALCQSLGYKPYCQFSVYTWPAPNKSALC